MKVFVPITKVDQEKRLVYGRVTAETPDKRGEVFDYVTSKPYYQKWSDEFANATEGRSVGNLRVMHTPKVAGKLTQLVMDDEAKTIECVAHVVDDDEWKKCVEGVYTGFSHGGSYAKRWQDGNVMRYTADPTEVSLVDNPALGSARFQLVKADGVEECAFQKYEEPEEKKETKTEPPKTEAPITDERKKTDEEVYLSRCHALGIDHRADVLMKRERVESGAFMNHIRP